MKPKNDFWNATGWAFILVGVISFIYSSGMAGVFGDLYPASVQVVGTIWEIFLVVTLTQLLVGVGIVLLTTPYVDLLLRIPLAIRQKVLGTISDEPVTIAEITRAAGQEEEVVQRVLKDFGGPEIGSRRIGPYRIFWRRPAINRNQEAVAPVQQ